MDSGLRGQVVLITGASGGIGGVCARAFAEEGARLVLHAHRNLGAAERLAKELTQEFAVDAVALQADLTREDDAKRLFDRARERFGALDVLVANAGIWAARAEPVHRMSLERWNRAIAADQTSVFLCAREFFKILEETRPETAALVIVGSTAAVFGEEGHAEYAAAKAAVTYGLTRTLKNEIVRLAPRGRVNAVCPGWTLTPMAEAELEDKKLVTSILQTRPIKRIARPEDVARAVLFLASDRLAGHITGEIVNVAGGMEGRVLHDPEDIDPGKA